MRKLLLASAAMLGGTMALASIASAQVAQNYSNVTQGGPPYMNFALPGPTPLGNLPMSGPIGAYSGQAGITVPPGMGPPLVAANISVRILGRALAYVGVTEDSGANAHVTVNPVGAVSGTAGGIGSIGGPAANTKLASYGAFEYARLYPSFDGVAANGLKYGAFLEIRQDNAAPAGGGANGSISGAVRDRGQLYFRRETTYMGSDNLGFFRFGATDEPTSLLITGNFENFDDGGWNGDPALFTGNAQPVWPFEDVGALYTTTKIMYLSPRFFNLLDFGVSWEPTTANVGEDGGSPGNCPYGTTANNGIVGPMISNNSIGCDSASSTAVASEAQRRRNTFDAVVRLTTAMGPMGLVATVGAIEGGHVQYNGAVTATTVRYQGLSVLDAGLQVTFGGLAFGGHLTYGRYMAGWGTVAPDGAATSFAPLVGASYTFGSNVVGFHFWDSQSPGSWTLANAGFGVGKLRNEQGLAVGDTFTIAPGAYLMLSYLYGTRHQAGVDLLSGATSNAALGFVRTNNNTHVQGIWAGTMFKW